MTTNWEVGDRIQNRWEIHKILRGGMGVVYVVYDHETREAYAAKTFQDEVFARSPLVAERFTQEALAWINLDVHQNVTEARRVENIQGKPYLFLEYVSGGDLSSWIGTPRLAEGMPRLLRFAVQFCDGMMHALSKGIKAHRDIKPHNCLVTDNSVLKVTDFGLARVVTEQEREGGRGGTPEYMPPEQWDNFQLADVRADVYSFGVMLYEMVAGQPPFKRRTKHGLDLEQRHKHDHPPELNSQLAALDEVIQTCLAKSPERRFADFGVVRAQLSEIYVTLTGQVAPQPLTGIELDATQCTLCLARNLFMFRRGCAQDASAAGVARFSATPGDEWQ